MNKLFSYNIEKNANEKAFKRACVLIESKIKDINDKTLLEDVDGSQIQIYKTQRGKIKVYNDYEVDAVYVDSEVDLKNII